MIGRTLLHDSSGEGRKSSSHALVFGALLVAVLIVGAIPATMVPTAGNSGKHACENPVEVFAGVSSTTHAPISIAGNAGFIVANGVSAGSGTISDPYIISDWEITTSSASGITINGTDAYFVIRNCQIHDGSPPNASLDYAGIALIDCSNGVLENNTCTSCSVGISLLSSGSNTLIDNNCSSNAGNGIQLYSSSNNVLRDNNCSNERAAFLWFSDNNTLEHNNCSDNWEGFLLEYSDNNTILSNNCSNLGGGIDLIYSSGNNCTSNYVSWITVYECMNCTLRDNVMADTGISIEGVSLSSWNTHSVSADNRVGGRPIYFYNNQNGFTVPMDAGQVILSNCSHFVCEMQNLNNLSTGIEIGFSATGDILNNNCSNSTDAGIDLQFSNGVTLSNNSLSNGEYGVSIGSSFNITLRDNNCSNNWEGIFVSSSSNNSARDNNCSSCYIGISIYSSRNSTLIGNYCSNGSEAGMEISNSSNGTISGNICSGSDGYGMSIGGSGYTIVGNNCSSNAYEGMMLLYSFNNVVMGNQLYDNLGYGISLLASLFNVVYNNIFTDNNGAGTNYDPAHVQAYDDRVNNSWNNSAGLGNYWSDWTSPDANHDGIVDQPYIIAGSAGAQDDFPRTAIQTPIPEFGMMPFVVMAFMAVIALAGEARRRKA
jgi:parallel beta-helix repeat protein